MSLRKTIFDTAVMSFVSVFRMLAQFAVIPLLSRILSPADYGVVAMAMPFIFFAMMFADAGIGMSLVRTPASERRIWSTCFWLSLMLGAGLAVLMVALAPVAAYFLEEPQLTPIIMVLSLIVFIQAASAIPGSALQQDLKFKVTAMIEIVSIGSGIAVAVAVAFGGGGVWALVLQQLCFYVVRASLTLWYSSFRPQKVWDFASVKEHLLFGRDILNINVIAFFARSLDNVIIGKVLTAAAAGVYSMAFQFARLPAMLVTGPLQYVLYSKLAQVKEDKAAIRETFLILTRMLAIIMFPAMGMVAVAYEPVFSLLLSEKWVESGRIFMLVATASAMQAVTGICGTVRLVLGRTDYQLRGTIEVGSIWLVALLCTVQFGLEWVGLAYSIVFILYTPRTLMLTLPLIDCSGWAYARAIAVPAVITLLCVGAFLEAQHLWAFGDIGQIVLAMCLAIAACGLSALLQYRAIVKKKE